VREYLRNRYEMIGNCICLMFVYSCTSTFTAIWQLVLSDVKTNLNAYNHVQVTEKKYGVV
jgi:hypothetical protein